MNCFLKDFPEKITNFNLKLGKMLKFWEKDTTSEKNEFIQHSDIIRNFFSDLFFFSSVRWTPRNTILNLISWLENSEISEEKSQKSEKNV